MSRKYPYDLGNHRRRISTASPEAQTWFDRGLIWTYAFNHEEAIFCFREALRHDPDCAMAHWGIAYACGPNYNKPWEASDPEERAETLHLAHTSLGRAMGAARTTEAERALIGALSARYPSEPVEDFRPWHDAYAGAMRLVHAMHRDDADVAALFAEAIMNRTPWQLWDLAAGRPAEGADTDEAIEVLEGAFDRLPGAWDHPGLLHMYIHLMEMSPHPERALRHGDRLSELVPDAGHLLHMATHIDVLCGDYRAVVARNERAIQADQKYLVHRGADNFYSVYRCHDYHFKIYGALFLGQPEPALATADELVATMPPAVIRAMPDWFEAFIPMKQHVFVRFGMWADILAQSLPEDGTLYCVTTAMMRYARVVALSNLNRIAEAEREFTAFQNAAAQVPETRMLFNNTCRDILGIAEQMALGELEYRKGNREKAFDHLRRSVALDDGLPYDEPWGWMQPTRHALGALLLESGRVAEAEAIYRADLGLDDTLARACQHPQNVWSLHGLHACLARREGDPVAQAEARHVKLQLDRAVARAGVPIRASCFCAARGAA